jgi:hypothetical protein
MLGLTSLVFFLALALLEEGGGGASLSGAAYTVVITGVATSATENIASIKSLIANLFMHVSCCRREDQ